VVAALDRCRHFANGFGAGPGHFVRLVVSHIEQLAGHALVAASAHRGLVQCAVGLLFTIVIIAIGAVVRREEAAPKEKGASFICCMLVCGNTSAQLARRLIVD
jgi:hypothetical protein